MGTSIKRKLTDLEPVPHHHKPGTASLSPLEGAAASHLTAAVPLQILAANHGQTPGEQLIEIGFNYEQRADVREPREDLRDESSVLQTIKGGEMAEKVPRTETKNKAALRQAKSERRSKKKRKIDQADHKSDTDGSTPIELAILPKIDREQRPYETDAPEKITSMSQPRSDPRQRFIVFIGNLPYTTTNFAIQTHFCKLRPFTLRHSTNKETGRSRGFAFLEFEGYDKMKTCLKLYHHSLFDAQGDQSSSATGKSKKSQTRKINVELTAGGGGGKSATRKEKIRGKNEKLEGERERARVHSEKEEAAANRKKRKLTEKTGANAVGVNIGNAVDENVHPSRRKRINT